jgi:hypothetical protein
MYSAYSTYIHKQHLKVKNEHGSYEYLFTHFWVQFNSYASSYPSSMLENPAFRRLLGGETEVKREKLMVALYT